MNEVVVCEVVDCVRPRRKRQWCGLHYERWRAHGTTELQPKPDRRIRDPLAHIKRFVKVTESGCWEWQRTINNAGYGRVVLKGFSTNYVHIITYTLMVGPIPDGLQVDHLCRNRACCNPDHLEPVTPRENVRRGDCAAVQKARHAARTHCKKGHELTPENVRGGTHGRECRECSRKADRERRRAKRARGYAPSGELTTTRKTQP